jgi:hypothetical protein
MLDLDTFLTTLYVLIDDWYKHYIATLKPRRCGKTATMSDSEVLTVAIAGQWCVGVPWRSERGVVRYMGRHGRSWFPTMLERSGFNRRVRDLCGVLAALQRYFALEGSVEPTLYEVGDGLPLPVCSLAQALHSSQHWLTHSSRGHGGTHGGWFFGQRWWVSMADSGSITGWLVADAFLNERWLFEGLLSARGGDGEIRGPGRGIRRVRAELPVFPNGFIGGQFAAGGYTSHPYLVDRGLNGSYWRQHWSTSYAAQVLAIPPANSDAASAWTRQDCRWHARLRQKIEGLYAIMTDVFGIKRLNAHSQWGQYTRLAAKAAAYNLGLYLNRLLERPLFAFATLLC